MKRREFFKQASVATIGAAAAATTLATPAIAQGNITWRMVTTWPKNFPGLGVGAQKLADRIKMELKGKEGGAITDLHVNRAWRLVLGRNPTAGEKAKSVRLVHDHELALLCRVLLNSNEFILVD